MVPSIYKDVLHFVSTCETCQIHSNIRHGHELRPTYPLTIHFKWMVNLVSMLTGVGQMKYLCLAREDMTNQVEGRALRNKTTSAICKFLLEEVVCRYGWVGKIVTDRGELDAREEFRTTRCEALPHDCLQSGSEWEDRARAWTDRQSHRTGMQQSSRKLATIIALCLVGRQNDT